MSNHQEDITTVNTYASINRAQKYMKQTLTKSKEDIDSCTKRRLQYPTFNNRTTRQKITKETEN